MRLMPGLEPAEMVIVCHHSPDQGIMTHDQRKPGPRRRNAPFARAADWAAGASWTLTVSWSG
jgi:hypothetical protein